MYVSLNPPALPGYQVLVGAIGCLEQTNSLGYLKTDTPTWSPQGHHNIKHFVCTLAFRPAVHHKGTISSLFELWNVTNVCLSNSVCKFNLNLHLFCLVYGVNCVLEQAKQCFCDNFVKHEKHFLGFCINKQWSHCQKMHLWCFQ